MAFPALPYRLPGESVPSRARPGGPGRLLRPLRRRRRDRRGTAGAAHRLLPPGPRRQESQARAVRPHRLPEPGAGGFPHPIPRRPHDLERAAPPVARRDPALPGAARGPRHAPVAGGLPSHLRAPAPGGRMARRLHRHCVERDVRQLLAIGDLLLSSRPFAPVRRTTGQLLNLTSLANDCGISQPTARKWLSVLEASYIVFRLPPFFANLGKRLVKAPEALLLRRRTGGEPDRHRGRGAARHPSAARQPVRDLG